MPANMMPYENATSGQRAIADIERLLHRFGCQSFGTMQDFEKKTVIVQFRYRDMPIHVEASMQGYAAAWLRAHPWSTRMRRNKADHEREAMRVASMAVYSVLRDWIKGQVTAVETGILSFEGAFLGQIMLPSGRTILDHAQAQQLLGSGST
jgi:ABC-type transport system involved in Fe-S cluster assembly fused permease/ATPase subunit